MRITLALLFFPCFQDPLGKCDTCVCDDYIMRAHPPVSPPSSLHSPLPRHHHGRSVHISHHSIGSFCFSSSPTISCFVLPSSFKSLLLHIHLVGCTVHLQQSSLLHPIPRRPQNRIRSCHHRPLVLFISELCFALCDSTQR
ncbi:uncharacterized protein F5Z01DRAFT_120175 [Emericellopsis atlantica]|uniref:Secreted protein n=1 Tax=Emericellopsis atlantica TaxID=2614577 RepID=A0A9P7ZM04_9HYPO|nr:uncharacterized protein F5Z01DRAFT_120175 [Emericellopsis atlantica]KAG9254167.1 hypothetical protein F5Z01DRAFT_120175 [Emericellopsis atlantica]